MPFGQFQVRWRAFQGEPEALFQEPEGDPGALAGVPDRAGGRSKTSLTPLKGEDRSRSPKGSSRGFQTPQRGCSRDGH